jgi:DNA polymerase-3 subunit alpha
MEKFQRKGGVGIYISGHPLDDYKFEMKYFCNAKLEAPKKSRMVCRQEFNLGGLSITCNTV